MSEPTTCQHRWVDSVRVRSRHCILCEIDQIEHLEAENARLTAQIAAMQQGRGRWVPEEVAEKALPLVRKEEEACRLYESASPMGLREEWKANADQFAALAAVLSQPTQLLDAPVLYVVKRGDGPWNGAWWRREEAEDFAAPERGNRVWECRPYLQLQPQEKDGG